ncbi:uncharacterized protein FIBRA_08418 [Fibroporia radiculosa]|uniref:Calcium uniporter protein, mitochondrial n=1 Tax=Fibroporia radiculosa TaxID=599839 RepID=J4ICC6_9APHY|nr:uncharacterized protein FIBRA_08418 [Fibroporia radiculosa]CCM06176.1 predicted protein [Fibroporia radiculosa]
MSFRTLLIRCRYRTGTRILTVRPTRWVTTAQEIENANVSHSRFLAEAPSTAKWKNNSAEGIGNTAEDLDSLTEGKGKLSPTSSHLFKLILPLGHVHARRQGVNGKPPPPTIFLLHPSQPLSHISRLILASLAPATPTISFRGITPRGHNFQWADSTDVGGFIRDAARATEFSICIGGDGAKADDEKLQTTIHVEVPTFADRTRYLRRRLKAIEKELRGMEDLKRSCDVEAHRGARRMAIGGLGGLVLYWGAVARLTFWDLGWDIMEPVTYLSGLSMVIIGYLWFLYQGREVSYSSVLQRSVSARRDALYKSRGLDIDQWLDLVSEARAVRKEIGTIAEDYDERLWHEQQQERKQQEHGRGHDRTEQAERVEARLAKEPNDRPSVARSTEDSDLETEHTGRERKTSE